MRISDWSSDVCSSDLGVDLEVGNFGQPFLEEDDEFAPREHIAGAYVRPGPEGGVLDLRWLSVEIDHRGVGVDPVVQPIEAFGHLDHVDRKSTRLNSSH